ncbi:MAG: tetratricopeptide repeat protein [Desulfatiglandales bacterium]
MQRNMKKGEELFIPGRIEEAEPLFLKLLEEAPDSPEILNNLEVIHHSQGKTKEAEAYFLKAIQADPMIGMPPSIFLLFIRHRNGSKKRPPCSRRYWRQMKARIFTIKG